MPIFEFECKDCGNKFELLIAHKDKDQAECPQCGSRQIKQRLSVFATTASGGGSVAPNACQSCPHSGGGCGMRF